MKLAIFDLDETLIAGDSATLWLEFLAKRGLVSDALLAEERRLMEDYYAGTLDMNAYMALTLAPLEGQRPEEVVPLVTEFIRQHIAPIVYPQARERLDWHRTQGHRCLVISATGEHLVRPIAQYLGVADAIGVQTDIVNGHYSGRPTGIFSFQHGKVVRLGHWLQEQGLEHGFCYGYSDSHNDLALLEYVDKAAVINGDETLNALAAERGWQQLNWTLERQP
ncbi:HAD family hydrolase [Oceanimonas baumannii]|uniref:Hydrolase n=1 Tax=Oceanimonas baumannii TaxID=129578 RepID=A0A235CMC4_9GAMM|nr:HAD family hydrolase [Oceanimonas baumannii]OYD25702.1 hydrolase [Oceanimonas baumannii]TDW57022.1 HAD superfamily hydrolase (TIGR01490 family) [Oceanimonas baumannii]